MVRRATEQYHQINAEASVMDANAHRLIQMLMQGALDKMHLAKGYMHRNNIERKGAHLSMAISIIDGLQSSLNREAGGEISENLYNLYEYMMRRLVQANLQGSPDLVEEVIQLLSTIKSGWDGISSQINTDDKDTA